jgi:hypothetical protein
MVTPIVLPSTNCCGMELHHKPLVGGVLKNKAIRVDGFQQIVG